LEGHLKNIAVTEERLQELQEFRTSQGFGTSCQSFGSEKLLQERMPRRHTRLRVPSRKRVSVRILFLIFVSCKFSKKYEQINAYYSLKTLQLNIFWHLFGINFSKLLSFIFKI